MKERKGQLTVGMILVGFIGILVSLILYQGTVPFIGQTTLTSSSINRTYTMPNNAVKIDLIGQELLSTPIVTNSTSGAVVPTTNYTIAERVSTVDGLKRIALTGANGLYNGRSVNVSYDYGAEGYIDDAAGRSVTGLIAIMSVLAIVIFAISLAIRKGWFDF